MKEHIREILENNRDNSLVKQCKNGHTMTEENTYIHEGYTQCKRCKKIACEIYRGRNRQERTERSKRHHRGRKSELVQYKGGKCLDCNGVFPDCVYDFEHRDPFQKSFNIGQKLHRPMDELRQEADKCDLVCANCHRIRTVNNPEVGKKMSKRRAEIKEEQYLQTLVEVGV